MGRGLPADWRVEIHHANAFCTAQHRPRVYIIGWSSFPAIGRRSVPNIGRALAQLPRIGIGEILVPYKARTREGLTSKDRLKLAAHLRSLGRLLHGRKYIWKFAVFEVDRDRKKKFMSMRRDGLAPCLRTKGKLWLVSLGEGTPRISRLLQPAERCLLQGMSPCELPREGISHNDVIVGCGNAMTVPVIGAILNALCASFCG